MKLKRFKNDNIDGNRIKYSVQNAENINENINENVNVIQNVDEREIIIERLTNYWSIKLKTSKIPESLYDYSLDELKTLENYYMDNKPSIFNHTIYRLPTDEELNEINNYDLSADEIFNGFSYTIIGRGITSTENKQKIIKSIEMLCEKYPENIEYLTALSLAKEMDIFHDSSTLKIDEKLVDEKVKIVYDELCKKYLNNEAVDNIIIEDNDVVFYCKCETEIQGLTNYDGINIRYVKVCDIEQHEVVPENITTEIVEEDDIVDLDYEKQIIEEAKMIQEQCLNEYIKLLENQKMIK
jgi:hypothetical protein